MQVELLATDGRSLVENKEGDVASVATRVDSDGVLPPGLPAPRVREGESKKQTWERLRTEARAAGMRRRDAYDYATREVERLRPYIPPEPDPPELPAEHEPLPPEPVQPDPPAVVEVETPQAPAMPPAPTVSGVGGLADMPDGWPVLPSNASLQTEVGWVQANRLRVCRGDAVDLGRSLSPAPSHAALGWLETSILYPAKFADVAVKAAQGQQDEDAGDVRREKIALTDMRTLLSEAMGSI